MLPNYYTSLLQISRGGEIETTRPTFDGSGCKIFEKESVIKSIHYLYLGGDLYLILKIRFKLFQVYLNNQCSDHLQQ